MDSGEVNSEELFVVHVVSSIERNVEVLYTLNNTHYGKLILVFRVGPEFDNFKAWAQKTVLAGCEVKTLVVLANDIEQVRATLLERNLLPSGLSRVAVEGTDFFDQVFAELIADTLWVDDGKAFLKELNLPID